MTVVPASSKPTLTAILRLIIGVPIVGALLFMPAGSFGYWQAWMWLGTLFILMIFTLVYLAKYDPALLERRSRLRETRPEQKRIIAASSLYFLVIFLLPGFDVRYGWSNVPAWISVMADAVVLAAYLLFFLVMKTNSYASRVVEIQEGQQVITSGPYALVRHPMYLAMILMMVFTPLALGSYWAVIPSIALVFLLAARIRNEEELLLKDLAGYRAYTQKTRFRLFPFIW